MITRTDPSDFESCNVFQIDCDAPDPFSARKEIDEWCQKHKVFVQVSCLPRGIMLASGMQYRSICYRIESEVKPCC